MTTRCYQLDAGARRYGATLVAGSPLTVFRLSDAGAEALDHLVAGEPVTTSTLVERLLDTGAIHPHAAPGRAFTADDVTVVVPTFGPPAHRLQGAIVVDDGSTPPVGGATVRLMANRGPGAARNAGLALVETPLVAFVDADVEVPAGWLDGLIGHFDDERVALVAPRVTTAGDVTSTLTSYEQLRSPLDLGAEPARVRQGTRVSYVPSAAIVCRTEAVRALDGFDEALRFGEDVDLVWRLDRAGWRLRYEPGVTVHHEPRGSWSSWIRQRIAYGSSAAPLSARHPGALAPLRISGWSLAAWALAIGRRPWSGLAVGAATTAALVPKLPQLPAGAAARLAAEGNVRAGAQIATAVRRVWWPGLALLAPVSRSARRALILSFVAAGHPIRAIDDVAYSVGVWRGMFAERDLGPAIPDIRSWPGSGTRRA